MILVDTSVWIAHFRSANPALQLALENNDIACHPFVIGELACGNLKNRRQILGLLKLLPALPLPEDMDVMSFVDSMQFYGKSLG